MRPTHLSPLRMRMAAIALLAAAFLAPRTAEALDLSLEEALRQGEAQSPLVRRALSERVVTAANRVGAAVPFTFNPVIGGYLGQRQDSSGALPLARGLEWGVRVEQSFEIAGQRRARLDEAARSLDVARARERLARVETRARVRTSYLGALIAQAQVQAARELETVGERLYSSAKLRAESGAASDVEVRLAEVERGRLAHARMEAELAQYSAVAELERTIGLDPRTPVTLITPLVKPAITQAEPQALLNEALAQRAELRVLAASRAQLDATLVRLHREALPSPGIFLELHRQQPAQTFVGGGISVPVPLWQRNQGPLAITEAEKFRNDTERVVTEQEIAIDVTQLYRFAVSRSSAAELWEKQIVPAAVANLDLVTQGWRAGKFDLFRVIQVAQQAAEARRKQLEVLGQLWQTVIELDRVRGAS